MGGGVGGVRRAGRPGTAAAVAAAVTAAAVAVVAVAVVAVALALAATAGVPPQALAQAPAGGGDGDGLYVFLPDKMIAGVRYEGMVLVDDPPETPLAVHLAIDSSAVFVPDSVAIAPGTNQAIFPVMPSMAGHTNRAITVDAVTVGGLLHSASSEVYSVSEHPTSLLVMGPSAPAGSGLGSGLGPGPGGAPEPAPGAGGNGTGTGAGATLATTQRDVPVKVMLADDHGTPVVAQRDTPVTLAASSAAVLFPSRTGGPDAAGTAEITIPEGRYDADVMVRAGGEGTVYALSDGLETGTMGVSYSPGEVTVRVGVAPDPAASFSEGRYYVWMERDGSLYAPDKVVDVWLTSGAPESVRFEPGLPGSAVPSAAGTGAGAAAAASPAGASCPAPSSSLSHGAVESGAAGPGGGPDGPAGDAGHAGAGEGSFHVPLHGGVARGSVWFGCPSGGQAVLVTAGAADGMAGPSSTGVVVADPPAHPANVVAVAGAGTAAAGNGTKTAEGGGQAGTARGNLNVMAAPDSMRMWVYPETPADTAWAVIGMYGTDAALGGEAPIRLLDSVTVTLTSDGGLEHAQTVTMSGMGAARVTTVPDAIGATATAGGGGGGGDGPLHTGTVLEIPVRVGAHAREHALLAGSMGMAGAEAVFSSSPRYGLEHSVAVTPIPSVLGMHGDIAYVYVADGSGAIADVAGTVDYAAAGLVQSGNSVRDLRMAPEWTGGVTTVSGTHVRDGARLHAYVPGLASGMTDVRASGTQAGVDVWLPERVNTGAEFPVAIHVTGAAGEPLSLVGDPADILVSSEGMAILGTGIGGRVTATDDGWDDRWVERAATRAVASVDGPHEISVISGDMYLDEAAFESFSNDAAGDVSVESATPETIRLGGEIALDLLTGALDDPQVLFGGGLDFEPAPPGEGEGRYVAVPEEPGTYDVTVTVIGEGWRPYTREISYAVEEMVDVSFRALADDGVPLPLSLGLHDPAGDGGGGGGPPAAGIPSGGTATVRPGVYHVAVSLTHEMGTDRTYDLRSMEVNGAGVPFADRFTLHLTGPSDITASYERKIQVEFGVATDWEGEGDGPVPGVGGNGLYRYGDTVTLTAEPGQELFGLVWHLPVEWHGLPGGSLVSDDGLTATFEALDSAAGYVEYEQNYAALLALVAALLVVPVVLVRKRSPEALLDAADALGRLRQRLRPSRVRRGPGRPPIAAGAGGGGSAAVPAGRGAVRGARGPKAGPAAAVRGRLASLVGRIRRGGDDDD